MSCGVGRRRCSDLVLLWLWLAATALIQPLAWELPFATGAALKKKTKNLIKTICVYLKAVIKKLETTSVIFGWIP